MKIAIQGGHASFHDIAIHEYFDRENLEIVCCDTFKEVCEKVKHNEVEYGFMAIENSIAGSILENYTLIQDYNHFICGEYKLRIVQNIMALPGQKLEGLKEVRSHYMALLQCKQFLDQYPNMVQVKSFDTADSAKAIKSQNLKGEGAIAGKRAAELYDL